MKKTGKKKVIMLLAVILAILLVFFMKEVPIRTFYYQTSTACNSNLYGGGNKEYFKYTILSGGLDEFNNEKSKLEAMNIPQTTCSRSGFAPVDVKTLELYML